MIGGRKGIEGTEHNHPIMKNHNFSDFFKILLTKKNKNCDTKNAHNAFIFYLFHLEFWKTMIDWNFGLQH